MIAHRGASGERPENTLAAFELAIEQSANMIETDLHLSRDGVVVVHHDAGLHRLGLDGEIRDYSAAELARLDAAPDLDLVERMPTLLDLLDGLADRIEFNLELKIGLAAPYEGIEAHVLRELEVRALVPKMLLSCFDDAVLSRLRAQSSAARLAVLVSPRAPEAILERAARVGAEAINPECSLVTRELVDAAHAAGLAVYPYTANSSRLMRRLLDFGVDGIITNYPARLRDLLGSQKSV